MDVKTHATNANDLSANDSKPSPADTEQDESNIQYTRDDLLRIWDAGNHAPLAIEGERRAYQLLMTYSGPLRVRTLRQVTGRNYENRYLVSTMLLVAHWSQTFAPHMLPSMLAAEPSTRCNAARPEGFPQGCE